MMIVQLVNELMHIRDNNYSTCLVLDSQPIDSAPIRFRFTAAIGAWKFSSTWFESQMTPPELVGVIDRSKAAGRAFLRLLEESGMSFEVYVKGYDARLTADERFFLMLKYTPEALNPLDAAYNEWHRNINLVEVAMRNLVDAENLCLLRLEDPIKDDWYFAYRKGLIWKSPLALKPEQWKHLIDEDRERLGLITKEDRSGAYEDRKQSNRLIPTMVRREVWRRDEGRCVECGSKERLEFDHIIPVAMGGSNTVRNIQLLCETCNRSKGASLG